jgi:hypothetical protein
MTPPLQGPFVGRAHALHAPRRPNRSFAPDPITLAPLSLPAPIAVGVIPRSSQRSSARRGGRGTGPGARSPSWSSRVHVCVRGTGRVGHNVVPRVVTPLRRSPAGGWWARRSRGGWAPNRRARGGAIRRSSSARGPAPRRRRTCPYGVLVCPSNENAAPRRRAPRSACRPRTRGPLRGAHSVAARCACSARSSTRIWPRPRGDRDASARSATSAGGDTDGHSASRAARNAGRAPPKKKISLGSHRARAGCPHVRECQRE